MSSSPNKYYFLNCTPPTGVRVDVTCNMHLASASMWASVVNGGYSVEQTMLVEWPLVHWSHARCYGQQHGWFYVNDDDDDEV